MKNDLAEEKNLSVRSNLLNLWEAKTAESRQEKSTSNFRMVPQNSPKQ
jgi:hypothetical protein|tara:strand:- start:4285 stop:4428 length:144 start_codon:yes stop_codon:yes gene_type:complete